MKEVIEAFGDVTIGKLMLYVIAIGFIVKVGLNALSTLSSINNKINLWEKTIKVTEQNVIRLDEHDEDITDFEEQIETQKEVLESQIKALKMVLETQLQSQREIEKDIRELTQLFSDEKDFNINYQRRSLADKLFICYHSAKRQDYITQSQLENFNRNVEMYEERGGNGIVHEVYIPFIRSLPVKD